MKVLIVSINYHPELTGIGKYTGEMAEWMASNGFDVSVITALPFYPEWKVHEAYKGKGYLNENVKGVDIFRVPLNIKDKINAKGRIILEVSFTIRMLRYLFKALLKPYDLIISIYPPLTSLVFISHLAKMRGIPHQIHIQDLQVDAAKELGFFKGKWLIRRLEKIEKRSFERATIVSTISDGMIQKVIPKTRIDQRYFLPNWADINQLVPGPKTGYLKRKFPIPSQNLIFLYSGNIGDKQGLDLILNVASELKKVDCSFVILGNGVGKNALQEMASDLRLDNVFFGELVPLDELNELLNDADFHLIVEKKQGSNLVMPSKLTSILSVGGVPIISASDISSARVCISKNRLGYSCDPESKEQLLQLILDAMKDGDYSEKKKRARAYAEAYLDKENILLEYSRLLKKVLFQDH
ncbi:MAG: WcaI family glycosyltransferase [Flavobacteriales bacterium]|nr:WcaI family glycosyltransferase [Flavobacteriales bacterium]